MTAEPVKREALALKPCPFCGAKAAFKPRPNLPNGMIVLGCSDPDCVGHDAAFDFVTEELAAAAWNSRPDAERAEGGAVTTHDTLSMDGRVWTVTGIFLGGEVRESVIGLQVAGEQHDATAYGADLPELFVPEILIRRAVEAGLIQRHEAEQ